MSHGTRFFSSGCSVDRVQSDIEKAVKAITSRKKLKAGETKESLLAERREELNEEMDKRTSVPRGTIQELHAVLSKEMNIDSSFDYEHLRSLLKSEKDKLPCWKAAVKATFDGSWERAVKGKSQKKDRSQQSSSNRQASNAQVSSVPHVDPQLSIAPCQNVVQEPVEPVEPMEPVEPVEPAEPAGPAGDEENIRTCSATLKQILRPDLMEHYEDIATILQEKQVGITNTMDELSALIQKTVLVVSRKLSWKTASSTCLEK